MISLTDLATKKMVVGSINYRYCLWFMVKREIKTELLEAANLACQQQTYSELKDSQLNM